MSIARKIAYNAVINAVAKVVSTILALVAIGFITRYLGTEGFGGYALALTFFSLFGALADFGLYSIATREISREGADENRIMGNVFSLRLLISLFVLVVAGAGAWFLPYEEPIKVAIILSALGFLFSSSYSVLNGIFQKNLVMDRVALIELFGKAVQLVIVILAVTQEWGFYAIMGAFVLNMACNFFGVFWASRAYLPFSLRFEVKYIRGFLRESMPVGISAIVTFLYFKLDTILLSLFQDTFAVGIYGGAYKIIENLVFFPGMIVGLVLPLFSRYIYTDSRRFSLLVNKVFKVFFVLAVPLVVGVWFTAEDIMLLLGGEDFLLSAEPLRVLVVALACMFFGNLFNAVLLAGNKQKHLMALLSVCAAVNIAINLVVIPRFSYMGAAFVSSITEALVAIFGGVLCFRLLGYAPRLKKWKGALLSVGGMAAVLYAGHGKMHFLVLIAIAMGVYGAILLYTKTVNKQELEQLFRPSGKALL